MDSTSLLPDFYKLLHQAYNSSDAAYHFHLRYIDAESASRLAELEYAQRSDARALIQYVLKNGDALLSRLE